MKTRLITLLVNLYSDKRAVTIIEYALLAALIGVALITILGTLKTSISGTFNSVATQL